MIWQLYKLRYRVLSPLHIGYQKIGNIQRTRHYVMARQMWGALTARLTRSALYGDWTPPDGLVPGDYDGMGKLVCREMAFSYFYLELESGPCRYPLFPYRSATGLVYGFNDGKRVISADVFAWRYLNSYASTALNYDTNAAEEGSLHETEFIAPQTRSDAPTGSYNVYLIGYIFVRYNCALNCWKKALKELQLGGERKYGWGRIRLDGEVQEVDKSEQKLFGLIKCNLSSERPVVEVEEGMPVLAHTSLLNGSSQSNITFTGDIEPFTSRAWHKDNGAGQGINTMGVYYSPGTVIKGEQESNQNIRKFKIGQYGLWENI